MSDFDAVGRAISHDGEDSIELSESFEKSAEVVSFQASDAYEPPPMMALDFDGEATEQE